MIVGLYGILAFISLSFDNQTQAHQQRRFLTDNQACSSHAMGEYQLKLMVWFLAVDFYC